ncbi:VOC family protein [Halalkalibacter hemicellulosilyticus]|uniref:Lactoylglutathione lyase n=1 Tax=Halalkalibacter hemicellulosilyticusJCM 9152 TaxID=1236971 RepID=W4QBD4_9BACI|nr:VOC family protein [Halalkalibacter hemicellulosilyticus]GAE29366.1 lactoylglutathione lyase [Halalkalibacter hemicellulosilyticusJCM 9152]
MKPRVTVITLGVDNLEKSLVFYRGGLGLPTEGIVGEEFENGAVAFFDLQPGLKLAIWNRKDIAHEAKVTLSAPSTTEFTLGHNVNSKAEVDKVMEQAKQAGATITDPAHDTFWGGYSGHFQDPDGHLWEVVWNPQWDPIE